MNRHLALKLVAEVARKYKDDPEMSAALAALDAADAEEKRRYEEQLKGRGHNCVVCDRRFLPLPGGTHTFCSIGCQFQYTEDP